MSRLNQVLGKATTIKNTIKDGKDLLNKTDYENIDEVLDDALGKVIQIIKYQYDAKVKKKKTVDAEWQT